MRRQAHESELSASRAATGAGAGRVAGAPCCRASRRCALMRFRWSPCVRCAAFSSASRSRLARLRAPLPPATDAPAAPAPAAGAIDEKSARVERPNVAVPVARAPRCKQELHVHTRYKSEASAHNAMNSRVLFATIMHTRS